MSNDMLYYFHGVNGQIEIYDNRIIINRKGFIAKGTHGWAGSKTIPINSIQSIQIKEATVFLNGFIQFGILGEIEAKGGMTTATHDENTVFFKKKSNKDVKQIKEFIENKIFNKDTDSNKYNSEPISVTDEIIKYKKLLDEGIINQNEFETKKKELLNL